MNVGVLSDIHANLPALEAVIEALHRYDIAAWICAGDFVGYGPHPNECIRRVRELSAISVVGNHDLIAVGRLSDERCIPLARQSLSWTRSALDDQSRAFLESLPVRAELDGVVVAHGSLADPEEYIARRTRALDELSRSDARALVLGHTHRALIAREGGRLVLNPGAVGQSRDLRLRARGAVLDTVSLEVRAVAVRYDARKVRRALVDAGLPASGIHLRPSFARAIARAVRSRR